MGEVAKKLTGISKMLVVIVIAAVIIIAAIGGAYWWIYLRPAPTKPGISLDVSPGEVEPGESITVSGSTEPAVAGADVTLIYIKPDGSSFNRTTTTDSEGKFTDTYSSDVTGKWTVKAEIEGEISEPAAFYIFVSPPIKVGAIGPLEWIQGIGIREAATLAVEEINDAGGVLGRKLVLYVRDEGIEPAVGRASMERLMTEDVVDFVIGGFRSEIVYGEREVCMDHQKIFVMTGSATNELLDCFGSLTVPTPCGHCVRCNYERYKYLFRVMPLNASAIFIGALLPYLQNHLIPKVLGGTEENKIKVAVVIENVVAWDIIWGYANNFPTVFTGPNGTIVYKARPSHVETDFTGILSEISDSGAQVIVEVFSAEGGLAFIKQWGQMQIPALCFGVNVLSMESDYWEKTDGYCDYEAIISVSARVPISEKTIPFYDAYVERWEHDPIYTSFGAYEAIYTVAEAIERANTTDSDAVVAEMEKTDRTTLIGRFKFTKNHDVYMPSLYVMTGGTFRWKTPEERGYPNTWAAPLFVQWRNGVKQVIFPFGMPYTTDFELPPWM